MTPRRSKPESAPVEDPNPLAESVDRLTSELRVLRQVLDEVREDVSWVTRNGLPVRPVEYSCVKRMALDPCAEDWGEKLVVERSTYDPRMSTPLGSQAFDRVVEELEQTLEAVAQGQLEVVLVALDGVRAELLKAIRGKGESDGWEPRGGKSEAVHEVSTRTGETKPPAPKTSRRKVPGSQAEEPTNRNEGVSKKGTASPAKHAAKPPAPRDDDSPAAQHEQWCREVRDPAIEYSEGRRTICTAKDEARLEYEIAPLPGGGWAVNWQYGFLGGSKGGASHPWVRLASREECLKRVVSTTREFFAVRPFDHTQQAAYREMQRRLDGGLFGFIEPEPVRDGNKPPAQ